MKRKYGLILQFVFFLSSSLIAYGMEPYDKCRLKPEMLSFCYGNELQHVLHQEFLQIIEKAAQVWRVYGSHGYVQIMTGAINDLVFAGVAYNKLGFLKKAVSMADCCWALCEILDTKNFISEVYEDTSRIGSLLGKAFSEIVAIEKLKFVGSNVSSEKGTIWFFNVYMICKAIEKKYNELMLCAENDKTFERLLTGKVLSCFNKIFKYVQMNQAIYMQYMKDTTELKSITVNAEGIPFKIADSIMSYLKKHHQS